MNVYAFDIMYTEKIFPWIANIPSFNFDYLNQGGKLGGEGRKRGGKRKEKWEREKKQKRGSRAK